MFVYKMKNAESIMAAFLNCYLVEKNNLFTETQKSSLNMPLKAKLLEVTTFCNFKFIQYKFYNQLARQHLFKS